MSMPATRMTKPPLHDAAYNGHIKIVKLLLEHGADVHSRDNEGETPLHWAINTCHIEAAKLLAAYAIQAAWRRFRHARAARVIQRCWVRAYLDPAYRVCQGRLHREFAALMAEAAPMPAH